MAYIILPHRWRRQPQYPVAIREGLLHSDAVVRAFLQPGIGSVYDPNGAWTASGAPSIAGTTAGRSLAFGGSSYLYRAALMKAGSGTGTEFDRNYTEIIGFVATSNAATEGFYTNGGSPTDTTWFLQNNAGDLRYYNGVGYASLATLTVGKPYLFVRTYNELTAESYPRKFYINGALVHTSTGYSVSDPGGANAYVGAGYPGGACANENIWFYFLERGPSSVWSDALIGRVTSSPEALYDSFFRPLQRRIYVPSAGGGITAGSFVAAAGAATAATMAGASTSAASFSVAAGVATAGTLAGASTAATAFSAASGVATAATLAGASVAAASFSVAAGVATAGTLTGASTAAVSFTAAAGVATAATMVGDALAQGAAAFVAASGVATTSTMQGASTAAADFTPASGLATTGLLQGVGLITVSADFVAAAGIATTATMAGADANTVPVAGQGGGAGYPYDYSDLKRTKSTRERIKEILDDAAEGMEEAVKGVPVVEALRRPVDAAGMARKMTRKPAPIGLPPPDDEDDDFLLLSH